MPTTYFSNSRIYDRQSALVSLLKISRNSLKAIDLARVLKQPGAKSWRKIWSFAKANADNKACIEALQQVLDYQHWPDQYRVMPLFLPLQQSLPWYLTQTRFTPIFSLVKRLIVNQYHPNILPENNGLLKQLNHCKPRQLDISASLHGQQLLSLIHQKHFNEHLTHFDLASFRDRLHGIHYTPQFLDLNWPVIENLNLSFPIIENCLDELIQFIEKCPKLQTIRFLGPVDNTRALLALKSVINQKAISIYWGRLQVSTASLLAKIFCPRLTKRLNIFVDTCDLPLISLITCNYPALEDLRLRIRGNLPQQQLQEILNSLPVTTRALHLSLFDYERALSKPLRVPNHIRSLSIHCSANSTESLHILAACKELRHLHFHANLDTETWLTRNTALPNLGHRVKKLKSLSYICERFTSADLDLLVQQGLNNLEALQICEHGNITEPPRHEEFERLPALLKVRWFNNYRPPVEC